MPKLLDMGSVIAMVLCLWVHSNTVSRNGSGSGGDGEAMFSSGIGK